MPAAISAELLAYYRATDYCVAAPGGELVLHIDEASPALAALHREMGVDCSAMITAWNPYSQERSLEENEAANAALRAELDAHGWRHLPAHGRDPEGSYPPEPGFLVAGMTAQEAIALGRKYRQNAVVTMDITTVAALGFCVD